LSEDDRATATGDMYRKFHEVLTCGFAPYYRTVVLSVCDVGALWPNSWIDQDET